MPQLTTTGSLFWLVLLIALAIGVRYTLVDRPRQMLWASFAFRCAAVVLLILALCRPFASLSSDRLHVVFLVDVSQSVEPAGIGATVDQIEQSIDELASGDSYSLVAFANGVRKYESTAEMRADAARWQQSGGDDDFRSASHLAEALRVTRVLYPAEHSRRVVVFSDGRPTGESLAPTMAMLDDEAIDVLAADSQAMAAPEAAIASIRPDQATAFVGQMQRLRIEATANKTMGATLRVVHRGAVVASQRVELTADQPASVTLDVQMNVPGPNVWSAEIVPDEDHFPVNNRASCTITVRGQPRLLVLHEKPAAMRLFERAMSEQNFTIDVRPAHGLPTEIDEMLAFDAIVIADVPATSMTTRQMALLKRYVSEFGGGVLMTGSENSFGLGGYYQTAVEDVLPLTSRFEKEKEKPSMGMVLVIDKSGSMGGPPIALARQAAKATVELLGGQDQIGVVAFDGQAYVISEMRPGTDGEAVKAAIDGLGAGGGTFMYSGMVEAQRMLDVTPARIKHMIILSDGHTQSADHESLVTELAATGVTVSTVALGGADRALMQRLAEIGQGRYYETMDPANVPQIFTRETMQASRSAIKEDLFAAVQVGSHPVLDGYSDAQLPYSLGYVMTRPKPTAQMLLALETGDPLLAVISYGLGTGMAFTSDLTPKWGSEWLAWNDAGRFWGQVLRGLVRHIDDSGIEVSQQVNGGQWAVTVHAKDRADNPLNQVQWETMVIDEFDRETKLQTRETGIGRYEVKTAVGDQKQLTLRVLDRQRGRSKVLHLHRPYPDEYRLDARSDERWDALPAFSPAEVRSGVEAATRRRSLVPAFVLLAIGCMIASVVLRRV